MMFYYTNVTFIFCGWGSAEEEVCHTLYIRYYDSAKIGLNFDPVKFDLLCITCITVRRERLIFKLLFLWIDIYATYWCIG